MVKKKMERSKRKKCVLKRLKILVILLSIILSQSLIFIPETVCGEEVFSDISTGDENDYFEYKVNEDGQTVTVTNYKYKMDKTLTHIEIPREIDGKSVTVIGMNLFYGCSQLESVCIPNTVTEIEFGAFGKCSELESIEIPESTSIIGQSAFYDCNNLESIKIPYGTTSIGAAAFSDCDSLKSVDISSSVTFIGERAFSYCGNLDSINIDSDNKVYDCREKCNAIIDTANSKLLAGCNNTKIPSGITGIEPYAFCGCKRLTSVEIPSSINSIGEYSFFDCAGMESINVSEENKIYDSRDECNAIIYSVSNVLIRGCNNTKIPESVIGIGRGSFSGCSGLKSIEIPPNQTSINIYTFSGCSSLKNIEIPDGVTIIEAGAFKGCSGITEVIIPDGVTKIDSSTFSGCSGLKNIEIPDGVTSIGSQAFSGCSSLTCIDIPSNVEDIGNGAFENCTNLSSIKIPSKITTIRGNMFRGCVSLTDVQISSYVTKIETGAFKNCSSLTRLTLPSGITEIETELFSGCSGLRNIEMPSNVTIIKREAFSGCSGLEKIEIPPNVTTIESEAFSGCSSLIDIEIPSSIKKMGTFVFSYCTNLVSVHVSEGIEVIDGGMFQGCSSLTNVNLPEGITEIGAYAFYGCSSLKKVILPMSLEELGYEAFFNCTELKSIVIPPNLDSVGSYCVGYYSDSDDSIHEKIPDFVLYVHEGSFFPPKSELTYEIEKHTCNEPYFKWESDYRCLVKGTCSYCKNTFEKYVEVTSGIKLEPTCSKEGVEVYTATFTDGAGKIYTSQKTVDIKKAHSLKKVKAKEATATKEGNIEYYECKYCHKYFKDENGKNEIKDKSSIIIPKIKDSSTTSVKLNETNVSIIVGGSLKLKATVKSSSSNTTLKWTSSNTKIATVSSKGVVTGKQSGKANITVTTSDGKKSICKVTVKPSPKKITFNKNKVILKKGKTFNLKYTITKNTYTTVTYISSNKKVVSVDKNGKIKALKKGTVTITVRTANGKSDRCKVVVE